MNKRLKELIICYIAQFGFDVIIGDMHGINLQTIMRLKEIDNEKNNWRQKEK